MFVHIFLSLERCIKHLFSHPGGNEVNGLCDVVIGYLFVAEAKKQMVPICY